MIRNPFLVFIFGIISIMGISYLMQGIQEYFACLGLSNCQAWGSFWGFLVINTIALGTLRLIDLTLKKRRPNKSKYIFSSAIIILLWLLFTFIIFSKFSKATDSFLEVPAVTMDDSSLLSTKRRNISWSDIKFALNEWRHPDTGRFRYCYQLPMLHSEDNTIQRIITFELNINRDSLFEYLHNSRGINILLSGAPRCIYPNYQEELNQIKIK